MVGFGDSDVSRVCQPPLTTMAVPHRKIGSEAGRALLERLNQETGAIENPSPPVYVCGKAAKTLIPSLPVSPERGFVFGVAGHPQRQRFERVRRKLITVRGDLLRSQPTHFADFIFLKRERPVGNAAKQSAPNPAMWVFKVKQTVFGKRHACNTQLFFRFAAGRFQ